MNRRHSAYWYIGSAMRLSMTLGLHHNITESQLPDLAARQMRARLWWTVYALDRFIASKIGHSAFILNDDIEVSPPSDAGLTDAQKGDVVSADYLCTSMRLASIAGETISTLYGRKKNDRPFVQKVQAIFKSLRDWSATLPESVRMWPDKPASWHIVALHLSFNQVCLECRCFLILLTTSVCDPRYSTNFAPSLSCHQSYESKRRDSSSHIHASRDVRTHCKAYLSSFDSSMDITSSPRLLISAVSVCCCNHPRSIEPLPRNQRTSRQGDISISTPFDATTRPTR